MTFLRRDVEKAESRIGIAQASAARLEQESLGLREQEPEMWGERFTPALPNRCIWSS